MPQPLDGLRVLELGKFVSAPYCGKLLAGYNAEVIGEIELVTRTVPA